MEVSTEKEIWILPDFLIVGAEKSGTTSLFHHLASHPHVFAPSIKEPNFLSTYEEAGTLTNCRERQKSPISTLSDYSRLFESVPQGAITGEASVLYLYDYQNVIGTIKKLYGRYASDLKIIAILRNPVDRAWSSYQMKRRDGREDFAFKDAINPDVIADRLSGGAPKYIDYLGFGKYAAQVKAWKSLVPDALILRYEDFSSDPQDVFDQVCDYLEIQRHSLREPNKRYNASGRPRHRLASIAAHLIFRPSRAKRAVRKLFPKRWRYLLRVRAADILLKSVDMPEAERTALTRYYRTEIDELEACLGWDLSDWKRDGADVG